MIPGGERGIPTLSNEPSASPKGHWYVQPPTERIAEELGDK